MARAARMDRKTIASLYRSAGAARWDLAEEDFASVLARSVAGRFPDGAGERETNEYVNGLRHADLALAVACEKGHAGAWEHFVDAYRPVLQRAASALLRDDSRGKELADSLWAELWGLEERDGRRRSRLAYYHGRSSLAGWLRALVAQRHVDLLRAERRTEPLEAREAEVPDGRTPPLDGADPARRGLAAIFREALLAVLGLLAPRDRLRLSLYYRKGLTLAEIGRVFGEHESSASRKLERIRRGIRRDVERRLRRDHGLDEARIASCYEHAARDWTDDLGEALSGARDRPRSVPHVARDRA
jgi:RNA polymerase sigma-70 factor